jgi:hypothetical protein
MAAVIQALTPSPTRCTSGVLAPNKNAASKAKNAPRAGWFFTLKFRVGQEWKQLNLVRFV